MKPPKLRRPAFLDRPPFARPTRADWAAGTARRLGAKAADQAHDAARHTLQSAARAGDTARERLRHAAKDALAHARFGPSKRKAVTPPPGKRGLFGLRRAAKPAKKNPLGVIEASAFFALAGVILAMPRPGRPTLLETVRTALGAPAAVLGGPVGAEMAEPGRGREAGSPLEMTPRGWRDVLARTWSQFNEDQIAAVAGGVTFFGLLAMFPAMAAFVSLYGLFADVTQARQQLRLLAGFMPHDVLVFVGDEMIRIAGGAHASLGVAFVLSFLFSLWSANGAVKALFHGLNIAYEERERRGLVKLNLISLAFTICAIVFALLAFSAVIVAPVVLNYLGLDAGSVWLAALRWPALMLMLIGGLALVYRYGPSRQQSRWRWISVGGAAAAVLWVGASLLFSWYVSNFAHYDRTYGSLGAVIGFMFWLWYSTIIVLFGAELNAELEHQTAVDTTTGPPLPMGTRGAKMADTLGAARKPKGA